MSHTCQALVVHCMDFRFENGLFRFLNAQGLLGNADIVGWAGAGKAFLDDKTREFALTQVSLSHSLHKISEIHIIQHRDCGGYGGSKTFATPEEELMFHRSQVEKVKRLIADRFPNAGLRVYGHFADFSNSNTVVDTSPLEEQKHEVSA